MTWSPASVLRTASFAGLTLLIVGCGSTNLTAAKIGQMQMGQTSEEQMKAMFGDPDRSGVLNEKDVTTCVYRYYERNSHPSPFVLPDYSSLLVEMRDNRMNGYAFMTTRQSEITRFDESAARTLKAGQATLVSVKELLGPPHGRVLTPSLIKEVRELTVPGTKEVWVYTSGEALLPNRGQAGAVKMLFIAFDGSGKMQNSLIVNNKLSYFF